MDFQKLSNLIIFDCLDIDSSHNRIKTDLILELNGQIDKHEQMLGLEFIQHLIIRC